MSSCRTVRWNCLFAVVAWHESFSRVPATIDLATCEISTFTKPPQIETKHFPVALFPKRPIYASSTQNLYYRCSTFTISEAESCLSKPAMRCKIIIPPPSTLPSILQRIRIMICKGKHRPCCYHLFRFRHSGQLVVSVRCCCNECTRGDKTIAFMLKYKEKIEGLVLPSSRSFTNVIRKVLQIQHICVDQDWQDEEGRSHCHQFDSLYIYKRFCLDRPKGLNREVNKCTACLESRKRLSLLTM